MPVQDDNKYTKGKHESQPLQERVWKTFLANPIIVDHLKRSPFLANTLILVFLFIGISNIYFEIEDSKSKADLPVTEESAAPITSRFVPVKENFEAYQQEEITKDDMESICTNSTTLAASGFTNRSSDKYEVSLIYNDDLDKLWPVYRWQCVYRLRNPSTGTNDAIRVGLDLDKFCKDKYGHLNLNRASHRIFSDDKLYCSKTSS